MTAELRSTATEARPGDTIAYQIVNHGPDTLTFGAPYILERGDGENWSECNEETTWTVPLISLRPGHERTEWAHIPKDGLPGSISGDQGGHRRRGRPGALVRARRPGVSAAAV